jgi:hypothetical protein
VNVHVADKKLKFKAGWVIVCVVSVFLACVNFCNVCLMCYLFGLFNFFKIKVM